MTLARLIREQNWTALEESWTSMILEAGDPDPALEALRVAAEQKCIPRLLPFLRDHAEMLAEAGRHAEAAEMLGSAMLLGGSPGELAKSLYQFARAAWGETPTWEAFTRIAELHENSPDPRRAWRAFRKLLDLEVGRAVYHAKGWGLGRIESLDTQALEVVVAFASGRRDRFPFSTAIEIFEIIERDDLRSLVVSDPERLARLTQSEPLEVLRWVLRRSGGKANHAAIKLAMSTLGVEGPRFANWWRKVKKEADASEWFELSGTGMRVQVRLLDRAEDPATGLRRQLARTSSLGEALARVRTIFQGIQGNTEIAEEVREAALDTIEELAEDERAALPERLAVWLLLREERGSTPERLRAELQRAAEAPPPPDPSVPPALWSLFREVPGLREQERCVDLLKEFRGDAWLDEASEHLPHAAPGMARALVEELENAGRGRVLAEHYVALLARPIRNPTLLIALAERIETGRVQGVLPAPVQRAQCLLQLAVFLHKNSPGQPELLRARSRLTALLAGTKPPLLRSMLKDTDLETLRGLASLVEGGVDVTLDRVFTRVAVDLSPDVFRGDEKPFWESGGTWTTRKGLRAKEEELRILREVKIPENSEAIGRAASYGDLSENSEWEAAIEEQRTLTTRAMQVETEVREAQLIENASLPEDTVCPGCEVRYRDLGDRTEHVVRILGPWDGEGSISYRSPLASGMLGLHPGERARVELPSGEVSVEVLAVRALQIEG